MVHLSASTKMQFSLANSSISKKSHATEAKHSLGSTLKKIISIVIRFLSCGRLCPPPLSEHQVRVINKFKERKLNACPLAEKGSELDGPQQFNETLEGMRTFAHQMVELTIGCVQKKYISPQVEEFNKTAAVDVPVHLKNIAKEAINLGSQYAKPIFQLLGEFDLHESVAMEKIDKILGFILKGIKPTDDSIVDFLDQFKNEIRTLIQTDPAQNAAEDVQHETELMNHCIDRIVHWLFCSNHSQSPNELFDNDPLRPAEETITKVMDTCMQILINKKIDLYTAEFDKLIQNQLPSIVEKTISENALAITDTLSTRIAEILDNMGDEQFTVLFDKMVEIAGKHVSTITASHEEAEKSVKNHKELEAYVRNIVDNPPKNPNPRDRKIYNECVLYLENLEKRGGLPGIEEDFLLASFLKLNGNEIPTLDNGISEKISKLILETLLPSVLKDGKNVNGLENLLSKITLPEQCQLLINEAKEIAELILTPERFKELLDLGKAADGLKDLALEGCAEVIKLGLNEAIELVVKQMAKPEELNLVLAKSALPSATETMMRLFADDLIHANLKKLTPYLEKIVNGEEKAKQELLDVLFKIASKEAAQFNFKKEHEADFHRIVSPRIEEMIELLCKIKKKTKVFDQKVIHRVIKEYYNYDTSSKDNNPYFANFVDAALRTGEFGSVLPAIMNMKLTRNVVSKLMTQSIQTLRGSYRPGLNLGLSILHEKYGHEEVIDELIKYTPSVEALSNKIDSIESDIRQLDREIELLKRQTNQTDLENRILEKETTRLNKHQELDAKKAEKEQVIQQIKQHEDELLEAKKTTSVEVDKISRLGFDMLMFKAKKQIPFIGQFALKKILGPNPEKISRVVLTMFNRVIGRQAFNEQLLSKIFLASMTGLHMTTKSILDIQETKPLLQEVNQKSLGQISIAINAQSLNAKPFQIEFEKPKKKDSLLKRIFLSVVKIFKTIGKFFQFKQNGFKGKTLKLSAEQILLMDELKGLKNPSEIAALAEDQSKTEEAKRNSFNSFISEEFSLISEPREKVFFKEENPNLNSSLQKVGTFVSEFMKKISDEVYQEKIEPIIQQVKNKSDTLPETIHKILDWASRFLAPLATTIVNNVVKKGYDFELDDSTRSFFDFIFKELKDKDGNFKNEALEKLKDKLKTINEDKYKLDEDEFDLYLNPLFNWLTQSYTEVEDIKLLGDFLEKNDGIMREVYVTAIEWLVAYKIESHVGSLQKFLADDLSDLTKELVEENMQHLSKLLFNRVAGLINNVTDDQYKKLFDDCASDLNSLMKTLILAEQEVKKNNADFEPEDIVQELIQTTPQGQPKYDLHSLARALLSPPENLEEAGLHAYKLKVEREALEPIVERMLELVFPKNQTGDALQELLENIKINPKVTDAINEFRQIIKSLIPTKYGHKLDLAEHKIKKLIFAFVMNSSRQQATKLLAEKLGDSFKIISDAQMRQEFLADNFPAMNQQIMKSFVNLIISKDPKPEKLFIRMIEGEDQPETKNKLINDLYELCKHNFKHSWEDLDISLETFREQYLPDILKGITNFIFKGYVKSNDFRNSQHLIDRIRSENNTTAAAHLNSLLMFKFTRQYGSIFKNDLDGSKARRCFEVYLQPFVDAIVRELQDVQETKQRQDFDADLTPQEIENAIEHYFEGENDGNTQYVDLIANMIKMGNFGGAFNKIIVELASAESGKAILSGVLIPALHPIRASIREVTRLTADGLTAKYLDDDFIKSLVNPRSVQALTKQKDTIEDKINRARLIKHERETKNPSDPKIREDIKKLEELNQEKTNIEAEIVEAQKKLDEEPSRYADIENRFEKGLKLLAYMLYDLIEYAVKHTTDNKFANFLARTGWHAIADKNPEHLLEAIRKFYDSFFDNHDLNEALQVQLLERSLKRIEESNPD